MSGRSGGTVVESVVGGAYLAGWALVKRLPERRAYAVFQRLADRAYARDGARVRMLRANLRRVVGPEVDEAELERLTRAGMRSYLRYWCEVFRLPTWPAAKIRERVLIHDVEILWTALDEGRGVVLALPHAANWDGAAAWVGVSGRLEQGTTFTTVAERVRPASLYDRFVEYRESLGLEVLPLTGGGNVVGTLARRLRDGGFVVLPADRDLTGSGVDVTFFGAAARMPAGPAMLAHLTGAALLTVDLWYDANGRTNVRLLPRIELSTATDRRQAVAETTQRVASAFEGGIAAHPGDWHMLQPLWLEDLPERADDDAAGRVPA